MQTDSIDDLLVKELYECIPEFEKVANHAMDKYSYFVYGDLSLKLAKDIISNDNISEFTVCCFNFFNMVGDRNNDLIDNLLILGVYEGLYSNKKCNDVARQLLIGRNKEIYEHWMINGLIKADY